MKAIINNIPTELTYRYSGKLYPIKISMNKKILPKHEAVAKKTFYTMVMFDVRRLPKFTGKVKLLYTLIYGDNRRRDRSNVLAKVEKYMNDALVSEGILTDDSDYVIEETTYRSEFIKGSQLSARLEIMEIL